MFLHDTSNHKVPYFISEVKLLMFCVTVLCLMNSLSVLKVSLSVFHGIFKNNITINAMLNLAELLRWHVQFHFMR